MIRIPRPRRLLNDCKYFTSEVPDIIKHEPIILVHGGAGTIFDEIVIPKLRGLKLAAQIGYKALVKGGAIDAVEQAIRSLDVDETFNSGKGSILNSDGEVEMDACIMTGELKSGAVTCVKNVAHPISLARMVMENTPYAMMASEGAEQFAKRLGMEILPPGVLVTEKSQQLLRQKREYDGTQVGFIGVIALDRDGNFAAGTSCGGTNGRMPGKSSDCCRVGCSIYADNLVAAVAVSGPTDSIVKSCSAFSIMDNIKHGLSPSESIQKSLFQMDMRLHTSGGAMAISKTGEVGFSFNTKRMPWAYYDGTSMHFGSEKGEHNMEKVTIP